MLEKIKESVSYLKEKTQTNANIGIILGTGLGGLVDEIDIKSTIAYSDIPNFPISTVEGHKGCLIFGELGGKEIIAMQGRFHYYEGYSMQEVTFPVRVMKLLGVETLMVSNACGGLNPDFVVGDIMIITDHINMFGTNPLIGKNEEEFGTRFPDMGDAYDKNLIKKAFEVGKANNIELKQGVYVGTTGPTFETPAEYKMFRILGADTVGMSTVPEVIVARHMNMTCFGVSVVVDMGLPGEVVEVSHEEVQKAAAEAEPKMTFLIKELVK